MLNIATFQNDWLKKILNYKHYFFYDIVQRGLVWSTSILEENIVPTSACPENGSCRLLRNIGKSTTLHGVTS
jgi:hypothetical protein